MVKKENPDDRGAALGSRYDLPPMVPATTIASA
jgi:hypothetical protein